MTRVGQAVSDQLPVTCGVPQGSILGPLLFSLFINDLPEAMPDYVKVNLYADDTALTISHNEPNQLSLKMQSALDCVFDWFQENELSLNLKKSHLMLFGTEAMGRKFKDLSVKHGDMELNLVPKTKYLGMMLDQLKFDAHVQYIKSKTIGKLKLLGRIRCSINKSTAELLYTSLILPMFDYADIIYDCLNQRDAQTLQRLQNMGIKTILKADKLASTPSIHEELNTPFLGTRRLIHSATEMFKVYKNQVPPREANMFEKIDNQTSATTRQSTRGDYKLPHCCLEFGKRNFRFRGPKIWSSVPCENRTSETSKGFKRGLRRIWSGKYPNEVT